MLITSAVYILMILEFHFTHGDVSETGLFVQKCPETYEWQRKSINFKCPGKENVYHCLKTTDGNFFEGCLQQKFIPKAGCPIFDVYKLTIEYRKKLCDKKCPISSPGQNETRLYSSADVFNYPRCLSKDENRTNDHSTDIRTAGFTTLHITQDAPAQNESLIVGKDMNGRISTDKRDGAENNYDKVKTTGMEIMGAAIAIGTGIVFLLAVYVITISFVVMRQRTFGLQKLKSLPTQTEMDTVKQTLEVLNRKIDEIRLEIDKIPNGQHHLYEPLRRTSSDNRYLQLKRYSLYTNVKETSTY